MAEHSKTVINYYDTHPINEHQIRDKLLRDGHDLEHLTESVLQDYDQDHYGGLESTECLASEAGVQSQHHVLDVGSGMGGPARYLAFHRGCRVTGLDFTESRIVGARNLTSLVKLDHLVDFRLGDAQAMPFESASFDVAFSQEAWLHVPNKAAVISECARVLRPGGMIAFTDLTAFEPLEPAAMSKLGPALAFLNFASINNYSSWLEANGFKNIVRFDRGEELKAILTERLAMYRNLGDQTRERFGAKREKEWEEGYGYFVDTVVAGRLGGCRFVARKDA